MDNKPFVWTSELNKRLLQLRYDYNWLFKKKKQPWREFHKILRDNDFPKEMNVGHVRKKWSYLYDTYKIAKRDKNKHWKYYKWFDKIFSDTKVLDKYFETWSDEWRLKLITSVVEAKTLKMEYPNMWRTVETAMRCQDLPADCCIQDMKRLWHHIKITFGRKHRMAVNKGAKTTVWPLYNVMLEYYKQFEPENLVLIETETRERPRKASNNYRQRNKDNDVQEDEGYSEFQWSKDITESFIQIRLQNDSLFRERKWAWNDLLAIMVDEYGFPKTLTGREICRKWAATYGEYQKARATNNKSWVYYTIFELYLGEGSLSLNPAIGWDEEWIFNLISARVDLEHLFKFSYRDQNVGWREVEKRLRNIGLPLNHSLLDVPEIWTYLLKTFRWKKKFADKGMLTEYWPYFDAVANYEEIKAKGLQGVNKVKMPPVRKQKLEPQNEIDYDDAANDEDFEDDMKLFDLKQKLELEVRPKLEGLDANQCRSCALEQGCVDIRDQRDDMGLSLADKLRVVGGVEVDYSSDSLPSQICLNCVRELENAFKFRRRCQDVDKDYRSRVMFRIKVESEDKGPPDPAETDDHYEEDCQSEPERAKPIKVEKKKPVVIRKRRKVRKTKYEYVKICEICGKHTKNLVAHLDTHSDAKSYACDVCDKRFKFKSGLIIHRAVHEPTPRKTCEVCGKTFHILAQYRRHFVYHANERRHECETCGKRFNTADILRVHARTHTDERPFACAHCGKTFRTAGCVSRHRRIVHRPPKPPPVLPPATATVLQ